MLYVHDERHINVEGFSATGHPFTILNCPLLQDDDAKPEGDFAVWMPYQTGQAAKTEALQKIVTAASIEPPTMMPLASPDAT